ncbi:hypothetical protein H1230_13215 [Paenibacillus sp. 19GGS1-52]|uniref:hypothetical protein n=1 Tax=Paenibacillus sp. 19GGS1-52 TaxID=2758563 RepID=UPI001EFBC62F|nr:hypothetical protein [Paenibacillus sp. 19GGS1-52]ULO10647.1 hypothetical protein H1230_13215 [Paenibacillus sp. 19GGS1-52]
MYGKMHSACLYGIEGVMIGVEIDLANGLPQTNIIGNKDHTYFLNPNYLFSVLQCMVKLS